MGSGAAIYATIPRLNSSCTPNCNYTNHLKAGKGAMYALRDIQEGEELTSSYTIRVDPRSVRRRFLKDSCLSITLLDYFPHMKKTDNFICHCETCDLPMKEQQKSDLRRLMAKNIDILLAKERDFNRLMMGVNLRIRVLLEEGLDGPDVARSLNDALQLCTREGHLVLASCFARLAVDRYLFTGNLEAVQELTPLIKKPQEHPHVELKGDDLQKALTHPTLKLGAEGLESEQILPAVWEVLDFGSEQMQAFEKEVKAEATKDLDVLSPNLSKTKSSPRR